MVAAVPVPAPSAATPLLPGGSLGALIRQACRARIQALFEVRSGPRTGYLYFESGQIIAAQVGTTLGDEAVRAMLGWPEVRCARLAWRGPPAQPELRAWARDVTDTAATGVRRRVGAESSAADPTGPGGAAMDGNKSDNPARAVGVPPLPRRMDADAGVGLGGGPDLQLDAAGNVLTLRNGDEDWAASVAYAARLGEIVGEILGLEGFAGLDCHFKNHRWLLARKPDGRVLASKVRNPADAERVRALLDL